MKLFVLSFIFLAIDPLNHNFKLKFVSSTVCLIIPDVIFRIDYNYIKGQQVMPFGPNPDNCLFLYCQRAKDFFNFTFLIG